MSQPKIFQRVLAATGLTSIPFLAQEFLTANDAYQMPEAGVVALEAALEAAEKKGDVTAIQAQLDAANAQLATAQTELSTATASLTSAQTELATAKTELTSAQADASTWKAKAIEFGAKPAEPKTVEVPTTEAQVSDDDTEKVLASLPHNKKADRILG